MVDVNEPPLSDNFTPLYAATTNNHSEVVKILLENGADPNIIAQKYEYITPIMAAKRNGHGNLVELFAEYDAQVKYELKDNASPIDIASKKGNVDEVEKILDSVKDVNSLIENDISPLFIASQYGHIDVAKILIEKGFDVKPGDLGENITTRGIDLVHLPAGTILRIGDEAVVRVTALRNPCHQINDFQKGLLKEMFFVSTEGKKLGRTGVMGVVVTGGIVRANDAIMVELPDKPHELLDYIW